MQVKGIPSFAPELLQNCLSLDPMKTKHLEKALFQFAEEGAAKIFKPTYGSGYIVGVVGPLQFEVLESRIKMEYGLPVRFEVSQFKSACWISGEKQELDKLYSENKQHVALDSDGDGVFLSRLQWDFDRIARDYPAVKISKTKELTLTN